MVIVYYEDVQTHEIRNCQEIPKSVSEKVIREKLKEWNASNNECTNAYIVKFDDESDLAKLFSYLFRKLKEKHHFNRELIRDALRAADEIKDILYDLEDESDK